MENNNVDSIIIPMYLTLGSERRRKILEAISRMIIEDNIFAFENDIKRLKKILILKELEW